MATALDLTLEQPKKLASSLFDVTKIEAECRRPYEYNTEYYDIDSVNQILACPLSLPIGVVAYLRYPLPPPQRMQKRQREAEYAIQSDQLALEVRSFV